MQAAMSLPMSQESRDVGALQDKDDDRSNILAMPILLSPNASEF